MQWVDYDKHTQVFDYGPSQLWLTRRLFGLRRRWLLNGHMFSERGNVYREKFCWTEAQAKAEAQRWMDASLAERD